jgi:FkbM family methyltransferase
LHCAIKHELRDVQRGVFFEAGANDGLLFSCTAYLERYLGWTGVLVEAVPHKFVECIRNRPRSIVDHCALVGPSFKSDYVELLYANLMSISSTLSDIDPAQHIERGANFLPAVEQRLSGQSFLAPARTVNDVLSKYRVKHVDFMVLDLEGAELEALKGLDFSIRHVDRLLLEVRDLPSADAFLSSRGYERKAQLSGLDYLYRRLDCP